MKITLANCRWLVALLLAAAMPCVVAAADDEAGARTDCKMADRFNC